MTLKLPAVPARLSAHQCITGDGQPLKEAGGQISISSVDSAWMARRQAGICAALVDASM